MLAGTPYLPNGVLITIRSSAHLRGILLDWERNPDPLVTDLTPAYDKILVEFRPGTPIEHAAEEIIARFDKIAPLPDNDAPPIVVDVEYNGEDLEKICRVKRLVRDEFIELHTAPVYEVAMLGFSPGFPYLTGLDPRLHMPRRATPRPKVAAGSVAIGGSHAGIYSIESPGGWNLIGHTSEVLFNPEAEGGAMFLLKPGDRVRFQPA